MDGKSAIEPGKGMDRRDFARSLAAGFLLPSPLVGKKKPGWRAPIAFSTLGCPEWDWETILATATRWDYAAIELRGLQGKLDLTEHPQFQGQSLKTTLKDLETLHLTISDLGSSLSFEDPEPGALAKTLEQGKRWIDLAHRLQTPYIRVFGDHFVEGESRQDSLNRIIDGLGKMAELAAGSGVVALIESHGDFTSSESLTSILEGVNSPSLALLWDTHHTFVSANEKPEFTFEKLGKWVRHTHIKDSVAKGDGRRYVLTGGGSVPVQEIVKTLAAGGYRGYYCFEWEKVWHPEIDDPESAIPHYATVMREFLKEAHVPEIWD